MTIIIPKLNRCDWFIAAWVVYYLQGILYPEGGLLSMGILGVNLAVSMVCAVKVEGYQRKPVYLKGLKYLLILFSIYGFWLILQSPATVRYPISGMEMKSYNYLKSIYLSLFPIYAFYYFTEEGYLTEGKLKFWVMIFFVSCIVSFYKYQQQFVMNALSSGLIVEEMTNNGGYLFLSLLPAMVLFREKPLVQFAGVVIIMALIILSMKRGAILIGAVAVVYFMRGALKIVPVRKRRWIYVFALVFIVASVFFISYRIQTSDYMMHRINDTLEGNSSGRDALYEFFWGYFVNDADFFNFLFGRGANGTLEILEKYAHNDWLEIAVNQGVLGLCVFSYYWFCFYKTWKWTDNPEAKMVITLVGIIYFAKTLFSMSYTDMTYVVTSIFGYYLANINVMPVNSH